MKWSLVLLLAISLNGYSQNDENFSPDSVRKSIRAIPITTSLRIDGLLNEPEWKLAPPSPRFVGVEPVQGAAPGMETRVRVLYNRQFLYIGVFSSDSLGKKAIRATDFKRDFNYRAHDLVTLAFDGFNDQRNAMVFATNPYGVQRDYLSFDDLYYDYNWDGLWRVRTSRTDSGWYAEMAIPWQTFRYKKMADSLQNWGFNMYRIRRATNEMTALSPFPRVYTVTRMGYAGLLENLQPPPPRPNIRIQPYVLDAYDRSENRSPGKVESGSSLKAGGEIKWAINPNNILDLTFNTDFAQADADLQVNSVSQFSVFFPERRQFFLENASLFSPTIQMSVDGSGGLMHLQPFFSRSIGLDADGNPVPILAGGRFVNRSATKNYGAIIMRQQEQGASPATNFFVGRYSQNIGPQSRMGILSSVKNTPGASNITNTLDGFIRLGQTHSLNTMISHSYSTDTRQQGVAAMAQYFDSRTRYKLWLTQSVVSRNYDPQMGFVSRTDIIGTTPGINWYYRGKYLPFKKIIRAFEPAFIPEFYWRASTGKSIEQSWYFWPVWFNFQNGSYLGYSFVPTRQRLTQTFSPLGITIAPGVYNYALNWMMFSTDPSKVLTFTGDVRWGTYYDGKLSSTDWKLQIAPIPHISIIGQLNRNHFKGVGIADTSATVDLYIVQGRFALNPRVQLTAFYQRNSLDHSDNYNVRFSWEYRPLSNIYIIYNHGSIRMPGQLKEVEDHAIIKISLLQQF